MPNPPTTPPGWRLVPVEPTEAQWNGLARAIVMWMDMTPKTPRALFKHLEASGHDIPQWLRDEPEMTALDHVPSKGTRAVLIYKVMLSAAPRPPVLAESPLITSDAVKSRSASDLTQGRPPAEAEIMEKLAQLVAQVETGQFDELEGAADRWSASVGVQRMMNAIASVFERYAPQDIMDRFREKLGALMHLAFVEGAAMGIMQFSTLSETSTGDQP